MRLILIYLCNFLAMVRTLQLGSRGAGDFGRSFLVAPMTTEERENMKACFIVNGSSDSPITPQPALPDLKGFVVCGSYYTLCDVLGTFSA